jgi:hypothetical protein
LAPLASPTGSPDGQVSARRSITPAARRGVSAVAGAGPALAKMFAVRDGEFRPADRSANLDRLLRGA